MLYIIYSIIFIILLFVGYKAAPCGSKKYDSRIVEYEGEMYEFRFWLDYGWNTPLPYAAVYKWAPPSRFLWWTIDHCKEIKCGWMTGDRVKWCWEVLESKYYDEWERKKNDEILQKFLNGENN